jgi:rubrerythrin
LAGAGVGAGPGGAGSTAATASQEEWKCSACTLVNKSLTAKQCELCDAPRLASTSEEPAVGAWVGTDSGPMATVANASLAGAGVGAGPGGAGSTAATANPGKWKCSACTFVHENSAATKCDVCDAPRG